MDLLFLRSFLAVAESGAIGDAASAMGVSQPALTRRIQMLEQEFEADLVERDGRGVALTEMGRLVAREGRVITERMDNLKQEVARHVRLEAGVVRVGGGATAVSYLLPPAIARFRKAHPDVRFEVREAGSQEVERAVAAGQLELGVVTLPTSETDLLVRPLVRDKIVLVAGKGHPLSGSKRISARSLEDQSLVGFEAGSKIRELIDQHLRQAEVTVNVVMELRSIAAILRMVETTGSLAFVSEMGAPKARVVPVTGLRIERQLALIQRKKRKLSAAAEAFASGLLSEREPS